MPEPLIVVQAFYRDAASGELFPLLEENSLMAADAAPAWATFRAAMLARGWEPLLSPPTDPESPAGYTKAMFRTPADQQLLISEGQGEAAGLNASPHQAGRAFDLDLNSLALYPGYSYATLQQIAGASGFSARVSAEPWHFDDNPAAKYGSVLAAVRNVGNSSQQVQADLSAGQDTPQERAVSAHAMNTTLLVAGALAALYVLYSALTGPEEKKGNSETPKQEVEYAF